MDSSTKHCPPLYSRKPAFFIAPRFETASIQIGLSGYFMQYAHFYRSMIQFYRKLQSSRLGVCEFGDDFEAFDLELKI